MIISLPSGAATGAQRAAWIKGHPRIRTGHLPRTIASLRNLTVSTHRQDGRTNIAAALRHTARDPSRPLTVHGRTE